jgi:hypothetical protein
MATKEELEAREADCSTAQDFAALAPEAREVDADYAKALIEKAEMNAQMPPDYVAAAEAAHAIGEIETAQGLFEQAEEMCFEPMELAAVGAGLAGTGIDSDKGAALLKQAAADATKMEDILALAGLAKDKLGDEALANELLSKVEQKAKSLNDYLELANSVKAAGNLDTARGFYQKAARYCEDVGDTVAYARGMIEVFDDRDWARTTLEEAETDCQFPKDFAALAGGFKALFNDQDKVAELMDQAGEFAMSAEENLDLARGYWELLADRDKAGAAYEKALPELEDKTQLMALAGTVATELEAPDLAKRMYAKAEQKMTTARDLMGLAESVLRDTGDKAYASEVYQRAGESISEPNQLMSLGANIVQQLGDKEAAAPVFRKALAAVKDYGQHIKLLDAAEETLGDKDLAREVIAGAADVAMGTPELLGLADRSMAVLQDRDLARQYLAKADEEVTSLEEMEKVVAAVETHFPDDADWNAVMAEKLERRKANQAKYAVFQGREKKTDTALKLLRLADEAMIELQDRFYVQKLLVDASKLIDEEGRDPVKTRLLLRGVGGHLEDTQWAERILNEAAAQAGSFPALVSVVEMASEELADADAARTLGSQYLKDWEARIDAAETRSAFDYAKLAATTGRILRDPQAAGRLLDKAAAEASDDLTFAQLAATARELGDADRAADLISRAVGACTCAGDARRLARSLLASGFDPETVRAAYAGIRDRLPSDLERLTWAEGILEIFRDRDWATREYDTLAGAIGQEPRYRNSRKLRLEGRL